MKKRKILFVVLFLLTLVLGVVGCENSKNGGLEGKYAYSNGTKSAEDWKFKGEDYRRVDWKNGKKVLIESGNWSFEDEKIVLSNIKIEKYNEESDDWEAVDSLDYKKDVVFKSNKKGELKLKIDGKEHKYKQTKVWDILFTVIGGLGIFLLGMHNLSGGLQTIAGDRLKWLIGKVTNNRIFAAGIGTLVTVLIQSSSITTVMVVGFVNAQLMNLTQAIGVIMGANIGTTITGWILVVKIGKYGLPILGVAAMFSLFAKKDKTKYIATTIMGLGMIFFGLSLMKNGFKPVRSIPEFVSVFQIFSATTYIGVLKCIAAGAVLTMIVQSSSATLGITIGLAATGVIPFETAAALVLGENIGTTITAFLASFGATTNAKRAAYAHIIFNVLGVFWISILFIPYIHLVARIVAKSGAGSIDIINNSVLTNGIMISAAIASVHTGFNIANTLIFLPFTKVLAKMLEKIVPEKDIKAENVTHLDKRMIETPVVLVEQSKKEILDMAVVINKMSTNVLDALNENKAKDDKKVREIFEQEEYLDQCQKEISTFLIEVLQGEISHNLAVDTRKYLGLADEYESIGDYYTTVSKLRLKLKDDKMELSKEKVEDLNMLHLMVGNYFNYINDSFENEMIGVLEEAAKKSSEITKAFKELRGKHLDRLSQTKVDPLLSAIYSDLLNSYRKIKDHIFTVAEYVCEDR